MTTTMTMTTTLLSPEEAEKKVQEITAVLSEPVVDLWKLRELALTEGGLVNDAIRRRAWPKLVGLHDLWGATTAETTSNDETQQQSTSHQRDDEDAGARSKSAATTRPPKAPPINSPNDDDDPLKICLDFEQIQRDVARCTWHLLTGTQRAQRLQMEHKRHKKVAKLIQRKQGRLANLINLTLLQSYTSNDDNDVDNDDEKLRYYQGYHDVACIVLSTLGGVTTNNRGWNNKISSSSSPIENLAAAMGLDLPAAVLLQISQSHLRDCLQTNFMQLQTALRLTLMPLLAKLDPAVHDHLYNSDMEPFFAVSWVITWFSHEIRDTELVKRLFDVFLVSHPLMPIYLSVAMVLHPVNRMEVLECECDFAALHHVLTGLPKNSSMAGWKYRPGDGYVSDDEEQDEDNGTVSTGTTMNTGLDNADFLLDRTHPAVEDRDKAADYGGEQQEAHSLISSTFLSSVEPPARVSFQELIDNAIHYMRKIPPRKLLALATRYYGPEQVQEMLQKAQVISFFETPPSWALEASAKADWLLKQQARERRGMSATNRRDRRRERKRARSRSRSLTRADASKRSHNNQVVAKNDQESIERYLKENRKSIPVIALGFGGDDEERRRRKRRKVMVAGAIAVAVVAVTVGVAMQYNNSQQPTTTASEKTIQSPPLPSAKEKVSQQRIAAAVREESLVENVAPGNAATPQVKALLLHSSTKETMSALIDKPTRPQSTSTASVVEVEKKSAVTEKRAVITKDVLSSSWTADASDYAALLSALKRVAVREATRLTTRLEKLHAVVKGQELQTLSMRLASSVIEESRKSLVPQLHMLSSSITSMAQETRNSALGRKLELVLLHIRDSCVGQKLQGTLRKLLPGSS